MTALPPPDDTSIAASPAETANSSSSQRKHQIIDTDKDVIGIDIPNDSSRQSHHQDHDGESDNDGPSGTSDTTIGHNLPLEYQHLEIDLSNNNLDPFEYIFRKYIPIPRVYFWETASSANDHHKQLPFKIKLWHRSIYYLGEILHKAEAGGEVVANFWGLNDGPFEYVTQNITEEEMARSRNILERRGRTAERMREGHV